MAHPTELPRISDRWALFSDVDGRLGCIADRRQAGHATPGPSLPRRPPDETVARLACREFRVPRGGIGAAIEPAGEDRNTPAHPGIRNREDPITWTEAALPENPPTSGESANVES